MTPANEEVQALATALFGEGSLAEVLAALDDYGTERHEPEVNRVRLAILQLSEGEKEKLRYWIKTAKVDYRDILAAQQLGPLSPQEGAQWQARAKDLIENWGRKQPRTNGRRIRSDMTSTPLELLSEHACFGGAQRFYQHASREIGLPMRFSVFLPPQARIDAAGGKIPALLYLAGLTCNEETFMVKAGAQRLAAELGLALIAPDTSPRGAHIPGEADSWDFGVGAGFYLDATQAPWSRHWRMESWLTAELLPLLAGALPIDAGRIGIFGHSMGGHGALTLALRHPGLFKSVSALAPICAPSQCSWGRKAFTGYLGADESTWLAHDASALMLRRTSAPYPGGILIDQGLNDGFLIGQLHPEQFEAACAAAAQPLRLRRHAGYDHGYYFIATFMADHLAHHAEQLGHALASH
jgi:S-formylglutathione hydrolase